MDIHTLTPLSICIHMHTIIVQYLLSFADTDVEKCIARTDNEGWALICAGGEAEIGE